MKVRVRFHSAALSQASVHITPSWFERLLLREQPRDFVVYAVLPLYGHAIEWYDDELRRRVTSRRILSALQRAWDEADEAECERVAR